MTDEKKKALLSVLDGMDVSEVISLLIMSGNSYSRRLLKFIKWITKWLPICIMVWHSFAMLDFSQNPREMFIVHSEHWPSYTFIYVYMCYCMYYHLCSYCSVDSSGCVGYTGFRSFTTSV